MIQQLTFPWPDPALPHPPKRWFYHKFISLLVPSTDLWTIRRHFTWIPKWSECQIVLLRALNVGQLEIFVFGNLFWTMWMQQICDKDIMWDAKVYQCVRHKNFFCIVIYFSGYIYSFCFIHHVDLTVIFIISYFQQFTSTIMVTAFALLNILQKQI